MRKSVQSLDPRSFRRLSDSRGKRPVIPSAMPDDHHHSPHCRDQRTGRACVQRTDAVHIQHAVNRFSRWVLWRRRRGTVNGAIKCQQISGGDGYSTDGRRHPDVHVLVRTALWFGGRRGWPSVDPVPGHLQHALSGHADTRRSGYDRRGLDRRLTVDSRDPASRQPSRLTWNGAVGLAPDVAANVTVSDLVEGPLYPRAAHHGPQPFRLPRGCTSFTANTVTALDGRSLGPCESEQQVVISNASRLRAARRPRRAMRALGQSAAWPPEPPA